MEILTGSHERAVTTMALDGRLDALEAGQLRGILSETIERGDVNIAIDLSAVDFVDSAGLAALVKGMKDARQAGGDVKLVAPKSADAMRVFELTRFDRVFEMASELSSLVEKW